MTLDDITLTRYNEDKKSEGIERITYLAIVSQRMTGRINGNQTGEAKDHISLIKA